MKLKFHIFLLFGLCFCLEMKGQTVAVKSNMLYDVTSTVNVGMEFALSSRWTFDISGNYNGWTLSHDRRWKHWAVQPEARY